MGSIDDARGNQAFHLRSTTLVGRGAQADWRLDSRLVSTEHASISWRADAWMLKDLASRNGTFVDARRLAPGQTVPLLRGTVLSFGADIPTWTVADIEPPAPMATAGEGWEVGEGDLLLLPAEAPLGAIFLDDEGAWCLEVDGDARTVRDGEQVALGHTSWRLSLPERILETLDASGGRQLATTTLVFQVSRDEEHIAVAARFPDGEEDLGARAHHALLLELARTRLRDAGEPEPEQGWMYADALARGLGIPEAALNLHVHRARRQLASLKVARAAQLVERRPATQQIRLGAARVEIR